MLNAGLLAPVQSALLGPVLQSALLGPPTCTSYSHCVRGWEQGRKLCTVALSQSILLVAVIGYWHWQSTTLRWIVSADLRV